MKFADILNLHPAATGVLTRTAVYFSKDGI